MTYKIWVKYEDNYPIKVTINEGDVDDLRKAIRNELPSLDVNRIMLRKHGEKVDLDSELEIDESFVNNSKTPIQIFLKELSNDVQKSDWEWPCFNMKQDWDVCTTLVELKSQPLIEILQEILLDNDNINDDTPRIKAQDLFHIMEELKILQDKLKSASESTSEPSMETEKKIHLDHLIRFLEHEYNETDKKQKKMKANKTVSFDMLWVFYIKDLEVWYRCNMSGQQISGTISSTEMEIENVNNEKVSFFSIIIKVVDYDSKGFKHCYVKRQIQEFDGEKSFSDLSVVPFKFSKSHDFLKKSIYNNGKRFFELSKARKFMEYKGSLFRWRTTDGCRRLEVIRANGRVMIDLKSFATMNPGYFMGNAKPPNPCDIELLGEKGYLKDYAYEKAYHFAPALVYGFSFALKEWGQFMVTNFDEIKFNKNAFDRLVMPWDKKDVLLGLVNQYSNQTISDNELINGNSSDSLLAKQLDPIANKGKGCIFLCYGPPGTGKTLTAESVAEYLGRPLWTIGVNELGTDPPRVEQQLVKILEVAFTWKAVLLLDEADIYLEERTSNNNAERNAMTSIFLRQLEYYQGILFLTTNRVISFDDAFCSRINMFFHYPKLNSEKRKEIWKNFINHAHLDLNADDFCEYELNGREIRNVVHTAQTLSKDKNEGIKDHVIKVIGMVQEFQREMREMKETKEAKLYDQDYPKITENGMINGFQNNYLN
ncbi:ATPase, AAA domain containing protein [Rhizophagus clarus]|uniref:ATPase, AAA domain containing protein n=1 Tax=Rhizophagus clarus TaxID=94130 RepID=A0A8H3LGR5_9GLOM|nr:ATPase, AAA domain containing protein [Rhizophagus clarus]